MSQANSVFSSVAESRTSSEEASGMPVLDQDHLNQYTLGDDALATEILHLFTDQVDVYLDGLKTAKDGLDWQQVAHGLKGSASAIGAWALADLAERAENGILSDVDQTRQLFLPHLTEQVHRTKAHITEVLLKSEVA